MRSALIVIDVQKDFCPGGALAVPEGEQVVESANALIEHFESRGQPVWFSRDWHPADHVSFRDQGGLWPPHCVQNTDGAAFHPDLRIPPGVNFVSKAATPERENYSAFQDSGLGARLRERGVEEIVAVGLATDYCVKTTVLDALEEGFRVLVVSQAIRAVDVRPGDGEKALGEMQQRGALLVNVDDILG